MGSSFIGIEEKGFWAPDSFVEVMQLCLIKEIENQKLDSIKWIKDFKCELALQSLPLIYSGMSMGLEEHLTSGDKKTEIVKLIDFIIEKIDLDVNYITGTNLHEMRRRAMTILLDTGQVEFRNWEDFEKTVNDSRWNESEGVEKVKNRYRCSFTLLKSLIKGELTMISSLAEGYGNY